jgi:hypothetical protein
MLKTMVVCLGAEALLFLAFFVVTASALSAIVCSLGLVGPVSLLIGPGVYRRLSCAAQAAGAHPVHNQP